MKLTVDPDHFKARLLQDALTSATAQFWLRRAVQFECARPRQGDYLGAATPEELAEAVTRCRETALACRRHAKLLLDGMPEEISSEVLDVLDEVA